MNWLDRAIGWLSPEAGMRRAAARAALSHLARKYEAAGNSRRTQGWRPTNGSANAEIGDGAATLRKRSRALIRDNPYAESAVDKWAANAIGTGITPTFENDQANRLFRGWAKRADYTRSCDFYGLQALAARAEFESGDALLLRKYVQPEYDGDIGLRLHLIEADHIDVAKTGSQKGGGFALLGHQFDAQGRRTGWWLYPTHPGEIVTAATSRDSEFWSIEDAVYLYRPERPGQMFGKPELASGLLKLRDLDEYEEAELIRKKIEACFVAFVRGADGNRTLAEASTITRGDGTSARAETLSPGMIQYLAATEDVTFGSPSVSNNADYVAHHLRAIAAGCGMTYEQLTGDYSKVTMGTLRFAVEQFRGMVDAWRWLSFIPGFCHTVERWFLQAAFDFGPLRKTDYACDWAVPRWPYIEPLKDVQAVKEEIKGGLVSLPTAIRERGRDPEQMLEETAKYQDAAEEMGVTLDTIGPNAAKAAEAGQAEADAKEAAELDAQTAAGEDAERRHGETLMAIRDMGLHMATLAAREPPVPVINNHLPQIPVHLALDVDMKKGATVREVIETDGDGVPTKVIERPAD